MLHVVILSNPGPSSFDASAANAYASAVREFGDEVEVRDLYSLDFDPRLTARELPWAPDFAPGADVVAERALLGKAGVIVLVYPLWFNAPPAMMKGYIERVLGYGFGYGQAELGTRPLLGGKQLVSITTSGAPDAWVNQTGAVSRLRADFDDHVAAVCGLIVVEHLHLGGVTPGIRADAVEAMLGQVKAMASKHFQPART